MNHEHVTSPLLIPCSSCVLQVACYVLHSTNVLTDKGKSYLMKTQLEKEEEAMLQKNKTKKMPKKRTEFNSLVPLIISVLHKTPGNDKLTLSFLEICLCLSSIQPSTYVTDRLLLFFITYNYTKGLEAESPLDFLGKKPDDTWSKNFGHDIVTCVKKAVLLHCGNAPFDDVLQYYSHLPDYDKRKHEQSPLNVGGLKTARCAVGIGRPSATWRPAHNNFSAIFRGSLPEMLFLATARFVKKNLTKHKKLFKEHSIRQVAMMKYE